MLCSYNVMNVHYIHVVYIPDVRHTTHTFFFLCVADTTYQSDNSKAPNFHQPLRAIRIGYPFAFLRTLSQLCNPPLERKRVKLFLAFVFSPLPYR